MSLSQQDIKSIKIKVISTDLLLASGLPDAPVEADAQPWAPAFCPRTFVKDHKDIVTEAFALEPTELQKLGAQASELRSRFLREAEEEEAADGKGLGLEQKEVEKMVKKIRARGSTRDRGPSLAGDVDFRDPVPPGQRKRSRKQGPLSVSSRTSIVHQVLVEHEMQAEVAKEWRVSPKVVNKLVQKV